MIRSAVITVGGLLAGFVLALGVIMAFSSVNTTQAQTVTPEAPPATGFGGIR